MLILVLKVILLMIDVLDHFLDTHQLKQLCIYRVILGAVFHHEQLG